MTEVNDTAVCNSTRNDLDALNLWQMPQSFQIIIHDQILLTDAEKLPSLLYRVFVQVGLCLIKAHACNDGRQVNPWKEHPIHRLLARCLCSEERNRLLAFRRVIRKRERVAPFRALIASDDRLCKWKSTRHNEPPRITNLMTN